MVAIPSKFVRSCIIFENEKQFILNDSDDSNTGDYWALVPGPVFEVRSL
jgi:hypothetical protein